MTDQRVPTDDEIRIMMVQSMEAMFNQSQASAKFLAALDARVMGTEAVTAVVDENETRVQSDRNVAAHKELISHLFEKAHAYTTTVVAGGFAAYFATLGTLAPRFSDPELLTSALLMTISLTVFVFGK